MPAVGFAKVNLAFFDIISVGEFCTDVIFNYTLTALVLHLLVALRLRLSTQKANIITRPPSTILDTGARYLSTSSY